MMLSIIVPIYNVKNYLEECINSLLSQDYKECEIIMVDDGSNDGSSQLCNELLNKDSRLIVIHQENAGLSAARNIGLQHAKGDYICFIDSDDYILSDMFTNLIEALEKNHADVAICNLEIFNRVYKHQGCRYTDEVIDYTPENQVKFFGAALDSSCNRVFRANVIRNHQLEFLPKSKVAQEDYWFQVRLFTHIKRIVTVSKCYYKYRERSSSITKSNYDGDITKRCLDFLLLSKNYISSFSDKEYSLFLNYAFVNMFMASINNSPDLRPATIKIIVINYMSNSYFKEALSKKNINVVLSSSGIKYKYDMLCSFLLRNKFLNLFSILESIRLKKLKSKNKRSLYFD